MVIPEKAPSTLMRLLAAAEAATTAGHLWVEVQPHAYRLQTEGADLFLASQAKDGLSPYVFRAIDKAGSVLLEFRTGDFPGDDRPDVITRRIAHIVQQKAAASEPTLETLIQ